MNSTMAVPKELKQAHAYYDHLYFHKPFHPNDMEQEFLNDPKWQKQKHQTETPLIINRLIVHLAFGEFETHVDSALLETWLVMFTQNGFAKSLVVHNKIADFYYFLQTQQSEWLQIHPEAEQILNQQFIEYRLLYASDLSIATYQAPKPETLLVDCSLVWLTPWDCHGQILFVRNPQTLLITTHDDPTRAFAILKNKPSTRIGELYQATLDTHKHYDSNKWAQDFDSVLLKLIDDKCIQLCA